MVHLDKVEGQTGSMVLHEDGSIISSTGDLSSSEQTAQAIVNLITHSLQVDFSSAPGVNGFVNQAAVADNGAAVHEQGVGGANVCKWNRITVSFGDHSYVACLSNKRVNVIKKDCGKNATVEDAVADHQNNEQ